MTTCVLLVVSRRQTAFSIFPHPSEKGRKAVWLSETILPVIYLPDKAAMRFP